MPRGTTLRNVRVADDLWTAARLFAEGRGENLSEHVVRPALEQYVTRCAAEAALCGHGVSRESCGSCREKKGCFS